MGTDSRLNVHYMIIIPLLLGKSVWSWWDGLSDLLSDFSFKSVLHDWYNKGNDMCYPVCGMMHIKEPLLLIRNSSPCGSNGFPLTI